jgi:carboxyl-terminal processing protease
MISLSRVLGVALVLSCTASPSWAEPLDLLGVPVQGAPPPVKYQGPDIEAASRATGVKNDSLQGKSFNTFWGDLHNRYAVFVERLPPKKTWEQLGREYGRTVNATLSSPAFYEVMIGMVKNLDDGHTGIAAEDIKRNDDATRTPYPFEKELDNIEPTLKQHYLKDKELKTFANEHINYGRIDDVGYIVVDSMEGLASPTSEAADTALSQKVMKHIIQALRDVKGIVVDVRNNDGGWDLVSLEIASWFKGPRALAWTKKRRNGVGFAPPVEQFVEDSDAHTDAFTGPVVLLQSGASFSAAETIGMAFRTRKNATFVGEPTQGHYSDTYGFGSERPTGDPGDGKLPNGWTYYFSGELFVSGDGKITEAIGIPVNHLVAFDPKARATGRDVMLDTALKVLRGSQ